MQPDKLNNFFASTAERTIGINAHHVDDYASIINLIQSLPANFVTGFKSGPLLFKSCLFLLIRTMFSTITFLPIDYYCTSSYIRRHSKSHETFGGNYDDLSRLFQSL
ncbi:hypothetical protein pdam_00021339 [Pocillopora damicornis]|uniref:Uncharacterized protein n=1 Tax=Pocillopora damicornis TaxID=46731 RepID=A0A3M6UNH5_POCDA|nr:hypothetical protein pdam_00021339 [Pocillopora damicornis]